MIWEHTPRFRPVKRQSGREGGEEEEWAKEKGRGYKEGEADETVKIRETREELGRETEAAKANMERVQHLKLKFPRNYGVVK